MLSKIGLRELCRTTDPPVNRNVHSTSVVKPGDKQARADIDIPAAKARPLAPRSSGQYSKSPLLMRNPTQEHTPLCQIYQAHHDIPDNNSGVPWTEATRLAIATLNRDNVFDCLDCA